MVSVIVLRLCLLFVIFPNGSVAPVTIKSIGSKKVKTQAGQYRGVLVEFPMTQLRPVEAFNGIPYATFRDGKLRFIPPASFIRNRNKLIELSPTNGSIVCPQKKFDKKTFMKHMNDGSFRRVQRVMSQNHTRKEDCLSLSVYVPQIEWNDTTPLPVMVFVHGESYDIGTGNAYDGSVLASYGEVIVVTVNYRLGVLGFLSTEDSNANGNYALLDLLAVLTWLNSNIGEFGGDVKRITLFGHGYGAALVNLLLLSPMADDMIMRKNDHCHFVKNLRKGKT